MTDPIQVTKVQQIVVSLKDAAAILGISRYTFREIAVRDRIPFLYRGAGKHRKGYYVPDLYAWVERHRIVTTEDLIKSGDGRRKENRRQANG